MMLMKKILLGLLLFTSLISCNEKPTDGYKALEKHMLDEYKISIKDYDNVLLLSDKGCLTCNKKIATSLDDFISNTNNFVIVSSQNSFLFSENDYENVFNTKEELVKKYFYPFGSYLFYKNSSGGIVTVYIDATNTDSVINTVLN